MLTYCERENIHVTVPLSTDNITITISLHNTQLLYLLCEATPTLLFQGPSNPLVPPCDTDCWSKGTDRGQSIDTQFTRYSLEFLGYQTKTIYIYIYIFFFFYK